ncbi:unnamed protein product [Lactuca virosa]|uniref:PGG domain-containing protein n=1 Tax=Lactuca virosa TaxID=75947 RepID=A0AAU9PFJ5_9ASTR|nr:unnamed protein product [Lactuca virosa]
MFPGKRNDHQTHQKLWRRSDALVKGWVLGSLSKETLGQVVNRLIRGKLHQDDFSAKDVWDELQTIFAPVVVPKLHVVEDTLEDKDRALDLRRFCHSTQQGVLQWIEEILREGRVTVIDKITNNGNTALHVAFGSSKKLEFLEKLLEKILENTQLMDLRNSDGSTLLHVAAITGNTEAVGILVARNPELLFAKDNKDLTPLALALSNMHKETARHLLQHINNTNDDAQKDALFSGTTGDGLLVTAISSKDFHLARDMLEHYKSLHSDAVLMSIAQNFARKVKVFERYAGTDKLLERAESFPPWVLMWIILPFVCVADYVIMLFLKMLMKLVFPFIKERLRIHLHAMYLLREVCVGLNFLNNDNLLALICYYESKQSRKKAKQTKKDNRQQGKKTCWEKIWSKEKTFLMLKAQVLHQRKK